MVETPPSPRAAPRLPPRGRVLVGVAHLTASALVALVVFRGLPDRVIVVDLAGAATSALFLVSGGLLLARHARAADVARAASLVALAAGLGALTILASAVTALRAAYGSLAGGALPLVLVVAALPFAYLVLLPAASLLWLGPRRREEADPEEGAP